ncbi:DUF6364 family protein [Spiroplasma endosymbiont of Dasysyrphus albostriatus]|uniref:DUF6364 family protein n=1 Tax=Spiroplasma endosymbiont of Dasysyrphus albostriatus TaxID=3066299 RepID=UPI0030D3B19D
MENNNIFNNSKLKTVGKEIANEITNSDVKNIGGFKINTNQLKVRKVQLSLSINHEKVEKLKIIARKNGISVSNLIEQIIDQLK